MAEVEYYLGAGRRAVVVVIRRAGEKTGGGM